MRSPVTYRNLRRSLVGCPKPQAVAGGVSGQAAACRLQIPREERTRMPVQAEAVPMTWKDENNLLVCSTQRPRLRPLLISTMQRAQVMVLLNSVHSVHL